MRNLLDFLTINAFYLACYAGLPALGLRLRKHTLSAERIWLGSLWLCGLQVLLGTAWSHFQKFPPVYEVLLFLATVPLAVEMAIRSAPRPSARDRILPWILLLACTLRGIAPVLHTALAQSDAYGHLQFLRDIVTRGYLRHPMYPPGHAWVSALPALLTPLNLYDLARYGGAFYGMGLVAGIYFLARRVAGTSAARYAALLAAAFPLAQPLLRTGIGLFANQLGLLLLPGIFYSLIRPEGRSAKNALLSTFALSCLALAFSVPMMFIDLGVLLAVNWVFAAFAPTRERPPILPVLLCGIGIGVLGVLALFQLHPDQLNATVGLITASETPVPDAAEGLRRLILDWLRPKSPILSRPLWLGTAAFAIFQLFLALWSQRHNRALRPLFLLGAVSGFQSVTGILQFSSYQRAGWFFLIAACLCGGWLLRADAPARFRIPRALTALLCGFCLLSLMYYPRHTPHLSPAEDELVAHLLRLRATPPDGPFTLWTRAFNDFPGGQGDPVPALLEDIPALTLRRVSPDLPFVLPDTGRHLFLLEKEVLHAEEARAPFEKNRAKLQSATPLMLQALGTRTPEQESEGWVIYSLP